MLAFVQCMPARPGLPHPGLDAPEITGYINDDEPASSASTSTMSLVSRDVYSMKLQLIRISRRLNLVTDRLCDRLSTPRESRFVVPVVSFVGDIIGGINPEPSTRSF